MIFTPLETTGIIYSQLLFDISSVPEGLLSYVGLLASVMGKLDTRQYTFEQLPLEINFYTGGIGLSNDIYSVSKETCNCFITINGKVLEKNILKFFDIIKSILFETDFTKKENLKKIIKSEKVRLESYLQNAPHLVGVVRSMSHIAIGSKIKEEVSGIAFYHFLVKIENEAEYNIDEIISKLQEAYSASFSILTRK